METTLLGRLCFTSQDGGEIYEIVAVRQGGYSNVLITIAPINGGVCRTLEVTEVWMLAWNEQPEDLRTMLDSIHEDAGLDALDFEDEDL